ncbi:bifunctional glycosyltransferase/CDP-glycerol:glycerophosphate glycerophosphotransferase [Streptomyces catenulae]|uniref:CDP-glycerol glycerophosphotransferase family protein n=1 Tax=Streptomyces catenulae TaxID=66875 RepID=A0ABV2Z887_9ACTN|nr:CDP-glycerol glycerophosphotransferase family protein [Streptomyces catenulae]
MKPRLTVVVPVHRTAGPLRHTEECLESIAAQTPATLDVVMVDGAPAPDGPGAALARRFTARDPRFRLVRAAGAGPGAARDAGARHAYPDTPYLAFPGPDDLLLPRAYEELTAALDASGADLATGGVRLLGADGRPAARQPADRTGATRTHIAEDRTLLSDTTATNKVFRRAFWDRHRLAFPEGGSCDDAVVTVPAHFLADAVDVLRAPVCRLRTPGDGERPLPDVRTVTERFAALARVGEFLADPARTRGVSLRAEYDRAQLTEGLDDLLGALPGAAPEVRTAFLEQARDYLSGVAPQLPAALPVERRMLWYLVRAGRPEELLRLLAYRRRQEAAFLVTGVPLRRRAALPLDPPLRLPSAVTRLGRDDFPVRAHLQEAVWRDGLLFLRGYAYIRNLGAPHRHSYLGTLVLAQGRRRIVLPLRPVESAAATAESGQGLHCYDWSGFEVVLDPRRLRRLGRWQEGDWRVTVTRTAAGLVRTSGLRPPESGTSPRTYDTGQGVRVTPRYADGLLRLTVEPIGYRLTARETSGGALCLTVAAPPGAAAPTALRLTDTETGTVVSFPTRPPLPDAPEDRAEGPEGGAREDAGAPEGEGPGGPEGADGAAPRDGAADAADADAPAPRTADAAATDAPPAQATDAAPTPHPVGAVPDPTPPPPWKRRRPAAGHTVRILPDPVAAARPVPGDAAGGAPGAAHAPAPSATWAVRLVLPGGATAPVACSPTLAPLALPPVHGRELVCAGSAAGHLVVHDRVPQPYADRVVWRIDGTLLLAGVLPTAAPPATELVLAHTAHAAEWAFPTTHDGERFHCALPLATLPSPGGPLPLPAGRWAVRLRAAGTDTPDVPVRFAPSVLDGLPASRAVRGKPFTLDRRDHDEVFLTTGATLPVTDRGPYRRRVLRETHYPLHRGRPLRDAILYSSFGGRAYGDSPRAVHEELVRRGMGAEHLWAVRDGQTAVPDSARAVVVGSAEWHGALAHSRWVIANTQLPDFFRRRQGQLVVQTWHGTPLRRIGAEPHGVHGPTSPEAARQWSVLLSPNAHSTPVLREALGFPGEPLESGLPRTDAFFAPDRAERAAAVRARLGVDDGRTVVLYAPAVRGHLAYDRHHHRLHLPLDLDAARRALGDDHALLVRGHPLVADRLPARHAPFAVDVTAYPDTTELLLAADVLVTDYSSLAADFANTGRPMLFLTPDLPYYRDTLRGFTVDFEAVAPGPQLGSTGELIDALRDLDAVARAGAGAYRRFRETFCHRDDGAAATRAADLLLR